MQKNEPEKQKEIGSEFWDVPTNQKRNYLFPENTEWFVSGRSALNAIIKDSNDIKSVELPSWCCESMITPFTDSRLEVSFYPVWYEHGLQQAPTFEADAIVLIDYFGYSSVESTKAGYKGIVIRDVTHSLFSSKYQDAHYYFGSLRKWSGFWTGGYAWKKNEGNMNTSIVDIQRYVELRKDAMTAKQAYINGESKEKDYLAIFAEAEEYLDDVRIAPAAKRDVELAHYLDIDLIRTKRRINAEVLMAAFQDWLIFPELKNDDCPMFVPILVPNQRRNELRKHLTSHSIYCPVHWPVSRHHLLSKKEKDIYDNEMSLVCDQRYTVEDMQRVIATINKFMGE